MKKRSFFCYYYYLIPFFIENEEKVRKNEEQINFSISMCTYQTYETAIVFATFANCLLLLFGHSRLGKSRRADPKFDFV